ncbi:hypothetical protein ISS08_01095 [Candidatus Pacearchaeota archaeon]|nr:hypothetical protein [Candidatus Pacearchaeota archaeon]
MKNFKIISENRNPLFKRKEVEASVESEITPGRYDVKIALSKELKVSEDQVKIKNVLGKYGSKVFDISANVYDTVEDRDYTEPKTTKEKKDEEQAKVTEEKAQEAAKVEEKASETSAEAPKEATNVETPVEQPSEAAPVEAPKEEAAPVKVPAEQPVEASA